MLPQVIWQRFSMQCSEDSNDLFFFSVWNSYFSIFPNLTPFLKRHAQIVFFHVYIDIYIYIHLSVCQSLWSFWQVGYWQKWCHWSRWIKECLACGRTTSNVTWLAIITTGQSTPPWRTPPENQPALGLMKTIGWFPLKTHGKGMPHTHTHTHTQETWQWWAS